MPDSTPSPEFDDATALTAGAPVFLLRTLVVDPDEEGAAALVSLAAGRGHEATACHSLAEAMQVLLTALPDILMVRLNHETAAQAAELVQLVRDSPGQCFVAAVTDGSQSPGRVEAWLKRGFDDFLIDPGHAGMAAIAGRLAIAEFSMRRRRDRECMDVEAVRRARRYEDIFQRSPEAALVVTARDGLIAEVNAAAEHVLGFSRTDLANRYLSLLLPDLFDRDDYDPKVLAETETVQLCDVRHRRPDGTDRWLDVLIARIPWTPGRALLLKFHDVTSLKDRESRRIHDARMDAASRVMAGAARELGDALTAVHGNLSLLLQQPPSRHEAREMLQHAQQAAERAAELGRRLGNLARAPQGGQLRKRPLHVRPLLEKTVPFALLNGHARPVLHVPDEIWPVEADEQSLSEVVRRLCENADEAMPPGGTLFVDAQNINEPLGSAPASVRIRLRDQGHGISPAHLDRVFDPWFTTRPGREGMGLAMAAAAVRAHAGHIEIASTPGQGTTVSIWLPVHARTTNLDLPSVPSLPDTSALPSLPVLRPPKKPRLLFMDDEAGIRSVVQKILSAHGYDVHCTRDGQEAIDAWRRAREFNTPFDLALVDLDVRGGMGGQEAIARLKGEFPGIKALLTTGYIDDVLMETYRDHGFLGVIPKPFQLDRLLQTIGRLLGVKG